MTELRNLGDGRTIVLHTNDNRAYRELLASAKPIKIVPYEQERGGGTMSLIVVDLYFPKEYRKWLKEYIQCQNWSRLSGKKKKP